MLPPLSQKTRVSVGVLTEAAICHLQIKGAVAFVKPIIKVTRGQLVAISSSSRSKGEEATLDSLYSQSF